MKKILSVIIAIALVMSVMLVSCKKETAESLVNGAMAKTDAHSATEINGTIELVMSVMGMEIEMPIEFMMQMTDLQSDTPTTYTKMSMSFMGEEVNSETYSEGDWVYTLADGEGYKMSAAESEDMGDSSGLADVLTVFPSEVFEGVEIVKNDDGTKSVEFNLTQDLLGELYSSLVDSLSETTGGEGSEVELSDAKIKITVKNGEVSKFVMSFDMIMSIMGIDASASCTMSFDFVAFDDDVKITPPEGYLAFPEY